MEGFGEYRNATPEEIRDELGLDIDASHGEVVAMRWKIFEDSQRHSGLAAARNERVADGNVSGYGDGATELMTPQTQSATEELTTSQLGSQLRQKGAE